MIATKSNEVNDTCALVRLVKAGDSKALDKILDLYIPQLRAFFRYIHVPEDSIDDLIQETFEKMLSKIDDFDESKKFSSWIMTIGRNLYVDQYRRRVRGDEILSEHVCDIPMADPEKEVVVKVTVEELLKNLDSKERFIVEMRVFQKMLFSEISELTGEQETTLRSKFCRVMSKLRAIL